MDEILEFIKRRFATVNNCWLNGNCYYFAVMLKARFPEGKIFYDVVDSHFVFQYQNYYYDWLGWIPYYNETNQHHLVSWDDFDEYDSLLKQRIIRDCIM